jgi:hypothetical protein
LAIARLDPGFLAFYEWAGSVGAPIVVLSGGLTPMIEAMLKHLLGHAALDRIEVVANDVAVRDGFGSVDEDGGAWRVVFRDDSVYGNDKGRAIVSYARHFEGLNNCNNDKKRPISLFAGDGVSDLSAAGKTDLLFAKRGEGMSVNSGRAMWSPVSSCGVSADKELGGASRRSCPILHAETTAIHRVQQLGGHSQDNSGPLVSHKGSRRLIQCLIMEM